MVREYQTLDELKETVYMVDDSVSKDEIDSEIKKFFKELLLRKRDDPFEGGLQAGGISFPGKAAFKVNENDGLATHAHTSETLAQFMNGETKFSGVDTMSNIFARKDDPYSWLTLERIGFEDRILMGKNKLVMAITTANPEISLFQLNVIKTIVNTVKSIYQNKQIKSVSVNYVTKDDRFVMDLKSMDEEKINELENLIQSNINDRKVL